MKKPLALVVGIVAGIGALFLLLGAGPKRRLPPCSGPYGGYGDVDGDGRVTQADVNLLRKYFVGEAQLTTEQKARADVKGDGLMTSADVLFIRQYLAGLIDTFPVCGIE